MRSSNGRVEHSSVRNENGFNLGTHIVPATVRRVRDVGDRRETLDQRAVASSAARAEAWRVVFDRNAGQVGGVRDILQC